MASSNSAKPNKRKTLLRLFKLLFRHKLLLLAAFAMTIFSNLLTLLGPKLSGNAINAIGIGKGEADFEQVFYYCGLMLLTYFIAAVTSYALSALMVKIGQRVVYQLRKELFDKMLDLPVGFFDTRQIGDIVSRFSYDIDTINSSLTQDFLQIVTSFIMVIGSLVMMVQISTKLILVFVFTVPLSIALVVYRTKRIQPYFRRRSAKQGELNGLGEELLSGQKTIRAYHQEQTMLDRFEQKNQEAVDSFYEADYHSSAIFPCINFVNNLSMSFISVFGAILYLYNHISLGDLSAFVLYSRRFSGPINEAANIVSEIQSAASAAERVFAMLDSLPEPKDAPDAVELKHTTGHVQLKNVQFGYDPNRPIIHNLNLDARPGSLVAIVGPTGAGKTTIINLLMRFYDPQKGQILLDGENIQNITRSSLRAAYTMVLQESWLFYGTIYDNIAFGCKNATREQVIEAAKLAGIHPYIQNLPQKYETLITEDGVNLSQGQKQMLMIARAMLSNAKLLILDEATSNVDTRTELQIQNSMQELIKGRTCFVIAHRLSTIQNADTILVVQNGDIAEQGTHSELLAQNGLYASLYHSQFE